MSLIDRHILKEWAVAFALTMSVMVGLLVLQNMYDTLPDLLEYGASPKQVGFFFLLALPVYFPAVLPIAFLVSLLFSLGTLHRNNEIMAMRASGCSLPRISRTLWVAGFGLSLLLLYLSATVVPFAVEQSRTFLENLEFTHEEAERDAREVGLVHNLGFDNRRDGRLWFMNRFSERAWLGLGVNVHKRNEAGREVRERFSARTNFTAM